jgi:hypothetical protein
MVKKILLSSDLVQAAFSSGKLGPAPLRPAAYVSRQPPIPAAEVILLAAATMCSSWQPSPIKGPSKGGLYHVVCVRLLARHCTSALFPQAGEGSRLALSSTSLSSILMLALDIGCFHQEIQCPRYFPWTIQPEHLEMGEIAVRQPPLSLAATPLPGAPGPADRVAGVQHVTPLLSRSAEGFHM